MYRKWGHLLLTGRLCAGDCFDVTCDLMVSREDGEKIAQICAKIAKNCCADLRKVVLSIKDVWQWKGKKAIKNPELIALDFVYSLKKDLNGLFS